MIDRNLPICAITGNTIFLEVDSVGLVVFCADGEPVSWLNLDDATYLAELLLKAIREGRLQQQAHQRIHAGGGDRHGS